MKRLNVGYWIVEVLWWIEILMIAYLGVVVVAFYRKKNLPIAIVGHYEVTKALDRLEREYNWHEPSKTKSYYKNFIEKDLGLKAYIYLENELEYYSGLTYPTFRLIVMDNRLDGYLYCTTFVHEAIHLTELIHQEDYVSWQTFKYLYESEELHNVGVWFAKRQILGYYEGEYNVADLIVDYLTKE